ncbi:MAG TPA: hypothetical protein VFN35_35795 [Ktedonobacteraceae bacterium]|nr:hypothetical protein [Ktedonobacteraceae bacterium]
MAEHDDFYTSAQIDEQVDVLFQHQDRGKAARDQRLVFDLQDILVNEQEDERSLSQVWEKLLRKTGDISERKTIKEKAIVMHNHKRGTVPVSLPAIRRRRPMFRMLAAVFIVVALVGGMLAILHLSRQPSTTSPGGATPVPTSIPTPMLDQGKIVYHSEPNIGTIAPVWSPDGKRIAEADEGMNNKEWQVRSWDALTGQNVVTYHINGLSLSGILPIDMLAWSPDGQTLAVAAGTGTIYLYDAQNATFLRSFSQTPGSALSSPAGGTGLSSVVPRSGPGLQQTQIVWSADSKYVVQSTGNNIIVWDASSGSSVKQITDNYILQERVFWQPHGKLLALIACADSDCASPDANSLLILDTTNWQTVKHYQNAANLSWSPDGKQLAIVSMGWQSVRIVDALSGAFVKQINAPAQTMIGNISWSPDGSRLAGEATGGRLSTISIWSVTNGKVLYTFPGTASEGAWSPDGKYISCSMEVKSSAHGGNGEVAIWIA